MSVVISILLIASLGFALVYNIVGLVKSIQQKTRIKKELQDNLKKEDK